MRKILQLISYVSTMVPNIVLACGQAMGKDAELERMQAAFHDKYRYSHGDFGVSRFIMCLIITFLIFALLGVLIRLGIRWMNIESEKGKSPLFMTLGYMVILVSSPTLLYLWYHLAELTYIPWMVDKLYIAEIYYEWFLPELFVILQLVLTYIFFKLHAWLDNRSKFKAIKSFYVDGMKGVGCYGLVFIGYLIAGYFKI